MGSAGWVPQAQGGPMDDLRAVTQRVFAAYNAHDPGALRALYAPAARTYRPGWSAVGGVDDLLAAAEMDMVAFPDVRITPLLSASEGDRTITEVRITGTNTGEIALGDFGRATTKTTADTL